MRPLCLLDNLVRLGDSGTMPPAVEVVVGGKLAAAAVGMVGVGPSAVLRNGLWDRWWVIAFL